MADILNLPNCGGTTSTFNTGVDLCDVLKDVPYGIMLTDADVDFSPAEMADVPTFVAAVKTKTRAARGGRVYPIWDLVNYEPQTQEATRGTTGNLSTAQRKLVDAIPGFKFGHYKGELFHAKLTKAEKENLRLIIIDQKFQVFGTKKATNGYFAGYSLQEFSVDPSTFATPQGTAQYPFNVVLASLIEYKNNLGFIIADASLAGATGLLDVKLSLFSQSSNVFKVKITNAGDGKNLFDKFDTELASVGAWTLFNKATGGAITITSVVVDNTNKCWTVTADNTAWGLLASLAKVLLNLTDTASLSTTYSVDGYESAGALEITKP